MGRGEEVGSARKGVGESKGSREMEYEGMLSSSISPSKSMRHTSSTFTLST